MWQKVNDLDCKLLILFLFVFCGAASATEASFDNNSTIYIEKDKVFSKQLYKAGVTYVIQDDFDLRENINGLVIDKSFNYKNKKYYRNRVSISLQSGQGIWVPEGVMVISNSLNSILSYNSFYLSSKGETVYLCSTKSRTINYMISGIITMPEDCVLLFNGGKLSNGIIRSVRTHIQAPPKQIFGDNMFFDWYWDIEEAYPEWFGAKGDKTINDGIAIQKCLDSFKKARLVNHQYYSSIPINIPPHGSLIGNGMFQTSICFNQAMENMLYSGGDDISTEIVISNICLSKSRSDISIRKGIYIPSATRSKIESVYLSGVEYGFALNSFFCSQIKGCTAYNCNVGFFLGINGGYCTTVDYDNCYANSCSTGHLFRKCSYITTKNTAADDCETAYDFIESCVTLLSPGAEKCKYFMKVVDHKELSSIGNYAHNNIHIINGQSISNEYNDEGVIYIATSTRGYVDRNKIVIDGFNIYFGKESRKNKLLCKSGDAVLHLNNLSSFVLPDIDAINYYLDGIGTVHNASTLKYWTDKTIGTSIFVKELNKPLYWNGNNWVDANGTKQL